MYLIILLFSLLFLFLPQLHTGFNFLGITSIATLLIFIYDYIKSAEDKKRNPHPLLMLDLMLVITGGIITFYLAKITGAALASGLVGFTAFLMGRLYKQLLFAQFPIFCGSFVGMTSPVFFTGFTELLLASLIAAILYIYVKNHFIGFGGKLGSIAFTSVLIIILLKMVVYA
ncbi:hypothetical protein [Calditerrivibrio nitroreducens]|uniref:Uncharacterized protein n=1 Tax=Calditerrivibrio nitroreducens (strain DSM 19672 / NBRC 101217 / Yu37-1) TaxID=768670 RepID=E4TEG5_CALNY|nr:hypothetical protein [Calditerrivibrio nitroreducens]ADR18291.1 hypothetical protein Calni_0378 [Calditerrivibrio nitroreducens DSM 19672]